MASLPYAGGFFLPSDKWTLDPSWATAVHYSCTSGPGRSTNQRKKGAATANAMFKQLSAQIRKLKATMRQDVADIRDKVAMWEVD